MVRLDGIAVCIEKLCEVDQHRADSLEVNAFDMGGSNLRVNRVVRIDLHQELPTAAEIHRRTVAGGLLPADLIEVRALRNSVVIRRNLFGFLFPEAADRLQRERGEGTVAV